MFLLLLVLLSIKKQDVVTFMICFCVISSTKLPLLLDDILHENGDVYHICSISSNLQYVLIYNDDERKLYQVQLNVERIEFLSQSARTPGEEHEEDLINEQVDDATALYGISIQNEVWKNEINVFHKEITRDGVINSQGKDYHTGIY